MTMRDAELYDDNGWLTPQGSIEAAVREMLGAIGEDASRPGLEETPRRVAKAWLGELFAGYNDAPERYMKDFDNEQYDQLIAVTDIPFVSHCEHHIMPFTGVAHVAYIPNERIVGLSKIPRLVATYSRRLQVQERLTREIADALETYLKPMGSMVVLQATHSCMCVRGIQSVGALTTTSAVRGVFLDPTKGAREEFLRLTHR